MTLADRLRARLEAGRGRDSLILSGDGLAASDRPDGPGQPAAVLIAITDRAEPGLLLTQRTETLRTHAGQIAFPGGRIDPGDAGPVAAALREAEEEIGLPRDVPILVGIADSYRTVTGYDIVPVLAVVPPDLPLVPQAAEVAKLFEVPLAFLLAPEQHQLHSMMWQGVERHFYEMHWDGNRIWGATAAMIVNLARRLSA